MNLSSAAPNAEAMPTNVVMVGMMGCGKSAIGRKIAESANLEFVDTDDLIVKEAGCSIPEIFANEGENGFRVRERRVLESLQGSDRQVIATGGGIVLATDSPRRGRARPERVSYLAGINPADRAEAMAHHLAHADAGVPAQTLKNTYNLTDEELQVADLPSMTLGETLLSKPSHENHRFRSADFQTCAGETTVVQLRLCDRVQR